MAQSVFFAMQAGCDWHCIEADSLGGKCRLVRTCVLNHFGSLAAGTQQSPPLQQPSESSNTPARKSSVVGSAVNVFGQAWMYITDEAAAVAAEGPDGLDKAAQHHMPMAKPHLHFNVTSQGVLSVLDGCSFS